MAATESRTTVKQKPGQAIVEALRAEGVDVVFGLVGSHVIAIYDALADAPDIRHITVKHEGGASGMADAYGRLTGKPGVCLVTAGPGATNSLTGVAQAYMAASPMIHISGAVPRGASFESFHGVDNEDFLMPMFGQVTKWSVSIQDPADIPSVFSKAFAIATSGRPGPVHIEIPEDVLTADALEMEAYRPQNIAPVRLDPTALEEIAEQVRRSNQPLIWVGKGVRAAHAEQEVIELAELLEAPVILSGDASGGFPDIHPLSTGQPSLYQRTPFQRSLLKDADLVLAIGLRGGTGHADQLFNETDAPVVGVWLGNDGEGADSRSQAGTVADIKIGVNQLIEVLGDQQREGDDELRQRLAVEKAGIREGVLKSYRNNYQGHGPMHYSVALEPIREYVDDDLIVLGDIGEHNQWTRLLVETHNRTSFLSEGFWGAMGFSLPAAMAAKLAFPEKKVVGVTGDGCFLMASAEFSTAVEYGLNPVIVILNDRQYGMIVWMQQAKYGRAHETALNGPDFVAFAKSFGGDGMRVEHPDQMREALERGFASDVIFVIDAVCDFSQPPYNLKAVAEEMSKG